MKLVEVSIARKHLAILGYPISNSRFYRLLNRKDIPGHYVVYRSGVRKWHVPQEFIDQVAKNLHEKEACLFGEENINARGFGFSERRRRDDSDSSLYTDS